MRVHAWAPRVPGITEVLHARFTDHAYPAHAHDTWTVLIVDEGAIRYDLDRHEHGAVRSSVTLLPPHVAHTGRAATGGGFRKRVLYVDTDVLDAGLTGAANDARAATTAEAGASASVIANSVATFTSADETDPTPRPSIDVTEFEQDGGDLVVTLEVDVPEAGSLFTVNRLTSSALSTRPRAEATATATTDATSVRVARTDG